MVEVSRAQLDVGHQSDHLMSKYPAIVPSGYRKVALPVVLG